MLRDIKEFTSAASCKNYSKILELKAETEKGNAYERAVAHKDIIREILKGTYEISDIKDLVDQGISSMYSLDKTNEAVLTKETENLARYLRNETRKPVFAVKAPVVTGYTDVEIPFGPDSLFVDRANREVEAVIYRSGSPSINQRTGIKSDKIDNMKEWFKLWIAKKYAYQWALENLQMKDKDVFTVKGSYYFLKKTTDSATKPRDNDFFSGQGGNIVSLEDKYIFGEKVDKTPDDLLFEKFMEQCEEGTECTEKDCATCIGKANCKYTKAPVKLAKKTNKKGKKITPSDKQLEVINATEGIFKVNATAGSGKTECMTERTKRLIAAGCNSKSILHISFTDSAVVEMKERISGKCKAEKLNVKPSDIECYTFNAFANKAIGEFFAELGFTKAPAILNADRNLQTIENIVNEDIIPGVDYGSLTFDQAGGCIPTVVLIASKAFDVIKTHRIDVDSADAEQELVEAMREAGYYRSMTDASITQLLKNYKKYNKQLIEDNQVTYADQEPLMFKVLEMHPEYFDNLGYQHIVVDEFQDSNEIQVETIKKLISCPSFKSLMVVGDDSQAIYAFRETTPEYIINFEKYIGQPVTNLFLTDNRRSTPEIIALNNAINNLNQNKIDKDMVAVRESGQKPVVRGFYSKKEEYEYIAEGIISKVKAGVEPNDIAFIAYTKSELQEMGTLLTKAGIPWVMKNPMNLMENSRVLAALSIADAFYQPEASVFYFNYLAALYDGEIFNLLTVDEINEKIADMKAQFESIDLLEMDEQRAIFHRYLEAIRNTVEDELYEYFLSLVYDNPDLQSELEYTRTFKKYGSKMAKKMDQSYEGVVLTTAHSSKGLEWPVVYVSVSKFDNERMHKTWKRIEAEKEERRRLLFVAGTRARDELYITAQYVAYGPKDDRTYNQFLKELYDITGGDFQPVDPMEAIKDAERKEARKKAAAAKSFSSKSRSMTDEEKEKYNKLVAGAKQASLFDFVS